MLFFYRSHILSSSSYSGQIFVQKKSDISFLRPWVEEIPVRKDTVTFETKDY